MGNAVPVCALDELPIGEARTVTVGSEVVAIFHAESGVYALTDRCSHAEVSLAEGFIEGDVIECPAHFGQFCLKTGEALALPAIEPVPVWQVDIVDGQIMLVLPTM